MSNTAREISWKALVKRADPKPPPPVVVYNFSRPKTERERTPGQPYAG